VRVRTDWGTFKDVRRCAGPEAYHTGDDVDCRVSANVGDIMAAALAAAGSYAIRIGGSVACETDYLAASGATFPDVPIDELIAFNAETLRPVMDEHLEMRRYAAIARFFREKRHAS
jgi:hypothetical protein